MKTYSETSYDYHFANSNVVFLASSGDEGSGTEWPSTSPNVIAVGGTTLKLDSSGNRISETGWQYSGGGVSYVEQEPQWQTTMGLQTMGNKRITPDVSFDADPNYGVSVYCSIPQKGESGWFTLGGTSLSSPSWAGLIADLNQNGTIIKNAGSLYALAGGSSYTNKMQAYHDVTSGFNGGYRATVGYDDVTGLGSPQADKMVSSTASAYVQSISKVQQILSQLLHRIQSAKK